MPQLVTKSWLVTTFAQLWPTANWRQQQIDHGIPSDKYLLNLEQKNIHLFLIFPRYSEYNMT